MTMTAGRAVFAAPAVTVVPIAMMILPALGISAGGSRFGQFGQKIRLVHDKVVSIQITRFGIFPRQAFSVWRAPFLSAAAGAFLTVL